MNNWGWGMLSEGLGIGIEKSIHYYTPLQNAVLGRYKF